MTNLRTKGRQLHIDSRHPLAKDIVFCVVPGDDPASQIELVSGGAGTALADGHFSGMTDMGPALRSTGSTASSGAYWANTAKLQTIQKDCTVIVWASIDAPTGASNDEGGLFCVPYRSTGWATPWITMYFGRGYNGAVLDFDFSATGGLLDSVASDGGEFAILKRVIQYAATRSGATCNFYVDGKKFGSTKTLTLNLDVDWTNARPVTILGKSENAAADGGTTGECPLAMVFSRALSPDEIAALNDRPLAFLTEPYGIGLFDNIDASQTIVTPGSVAVAGSAAAIVVVPGATTASVGSVAASGSVASPTISSTITVPVSPVAASGSVASESVVVGSSTIAVSPVASTGSVASISVVTGAIAYAASPVAATGSVATPTIASVVNASVSPVAATGSVADPSISQPGIGLPATAVVAGSVATPSISSGATSSVAPSVASVGSVASPTISATIQVSVQPVQATGSVASPGISGALSVSAGTPPSAVGSAASIQIVPGGTSSSPQPVAVSSSVIAPATPQTVPLPSVVITSSVVNTSISTSLTVPISFTASSGGVFEVDPGLLGEFVFVPGKDGAQYEDPEFDGTSWSRRSPSTHASRHKHGGPSEVGTSTPGANEIVKAKSDAKIDSGWIPATVPIDHGGLTGLTPDDDHPHYQTRTEKDAASGYAGLDSSAKVAKSKISSTGTFPWAEVSKSGSNLNELATRAHTDLTSIGTNTHAQIDTHVAAASPHSGHEVTSAKDAVSGYAGLDANARLPSAKIQVSSTGKLVGRETAGAGAAEEVAYSATPGANVVVKAGGGGAIDAGFIPTSFATDSEVSSAVSTHEAASDPHAGYQRESEKDAASGYAGLTAGSKIASSQVQEVLALADLSDVSAKTGAGSTVVMQAMPTFSDDADTTKKFTFEASGITAGTTRTLTLQNSNHILENTAHSSKHKHGGADEVASATSGANVIPKGDGSGKIAAAWGGSASTLATLNSSTKVVENPASAQEEPGSAKIPLSTSGSAFSRTWVGDLFKKKSSDTPKTSNTTLADDPDLVASIISGRTYIVDAVLFVTFGSTTPKMKMKIGNTGSASEYISVEAWSKDGTVTIDTLNNIAAIQFGSAANEYNFAGAGTANEMMVRIHALIIANADGTFSIQWAQDSTSSFSTVVKAGSWLRMQPVAP